MFVLVLTGRLLFGDYLRSEDTFPNLHNGMLCRLSTLSKLDARSSQHHTLYNSRPHLHGQKYLHSLRHPSSTTETRSVDHPSRLKSAHHMSLADLIVFAGITDLDAL